MPSTAARARGPGGALGAPSWPLGRRFHHMTTALIASSHTPMQPISMRMRFSKPYWVP
jgi:hypothetical protein